MTVAQFIKMQVNKLNISQVQLANLLNMTRQNFNNKLSRDNFTSQELYKICQLLNVDFCMKDNENLYTISYAKNSQHSRTKDWFIEI